MSNSASNTASTKRLCVCAGLVALIAFVEALVYVIAETRADIAGVVDVVVDNGFIGTGAGVAIAVGGDFDAEAAG